MSWTRTTTALGVACATTLAATSVASAQSQLPPNLPAGSVPLIADADARLANDSNRGPDSNTGSSSTWEVRWLVDGATQRIRIGYVRFDLSGVDKSQYNLDGAYLSGSFRDSGRNGPGTWDVWGLNDADDLDNWLERDSGTGTDDGIQYNNAPGVVNSAPLGTWAIDTAVTTSLGQVELDGIDVQPLPWASTPALLPLGDFLRDDSVDDLVTFIIMADAPVTSGGEYLVNAREGDGAFGNNQYATFLVLPAIPEPGTLGLLSLGGLGLIRRRR